MRPKYFCQRDTCHTLQVKGEAPETNMVSIAGDVLRTDEDRDKPQKSSPAVTFFVMKKKKKKKAK